MPNLQRINNNNNQNPTQRALSCIEKLFKPYDFFNSPGMQSYGDTILYAPNTRYSQDTTSEHYIADVHYSNFKCKITNKKVYTEIEKIIKQPFEIKAYKVDYNITEAEYCMSELINIGFRFNVNIEPEKLTYLNDQCTAKDSFFMSNYYTGIDEVEIERTSKDMLHISDEEVNEVCNQLEIVLSQTDSN